MTSTQILFVNFGQIEAAAAMKSVKALRMAGVAAEVYPDQAKMKKQMSYADAMKIPYVAIIGESELAEGKITLKNMTSGEQTLTDISGIVEMLK